MARLSWNGVQANAKTIVQLAPTATSVTTFYSVTQPKGIANPVAMLANATNASLSYRLAVAKGTSATSAVQFYASDVQLNNAAPPYFLPLADLEYGDVVFVRTSVANGLNAHLLGYELT